MPRDLKLKAIKNALDINVAYFVGFFNPNTFTTTFNSSMFLSGCYFMIYSPGTHWLKTVSLLQMSREGIDHTEGTFEGRIPSNGFLELHFIT